MGAVKMILSRKEKIDIISIILSAAGLIGSFTLSIDYLSWIAVALCGTPIFKECIEGLVTEFDIKADVLVSMAIIASIIIGEVFAAGEIATIMAIGGFLETYTASKTHRRIEKLVKMSPQVATRIKNGIEDTIPIEEIRIGDILKVLPGESIPTDGIILKGETSIDQSTLTGESLPVDKKENDEIYSGTMNLYGSFTMKTTKMVQDSSLQKLIRLVESSKPENAKIVKTADKWATVIVAIAFSAAILTYLFTFEITRSVTILVVFCPCALVLATPTAIMAAIGNLTKYGILVKDGTSLEELANIDELIFDKTGTLTYGTPKVVDIISDNPQEMLYLLASLESKSEHPLAKAIVKHYNSNNLAEVDDFKMHIGAGVSGTIENSRVIAGNKKLLKGESIKIKEDLKNNQITIYVAKDGKILGRVELADTLRESSKSTIRKLKRLKVRTTLLTGDNEHTAKAIAKKVKIRNVKSNCLPEDKTEYIKQEQIKGNNVAMIGDGINDAPSLRKANVGIAMGSVGSDISVEAADITLINDNVDGIPHLIATSRRTIRTINICIGFALLLNIAAMGLAILGFLNPVEGALIHNVGSVSVILYSLTLLKYEPYVKEPEKSEKMGMTKTINKSMTKLILSTQGDNYG
ncbi:MAG: cation-translocating P-type ATPase [Methanobrevibacter sp.]|nr:cation-translocating P-type ATPase [Methanobrevibacter sp.]